jgi:hypothetical protein
MGLNWMVMRMLEYGSQKSETKQNPETQLFDHSPIQLRDG